MRYCFYILIFLIPFGGSAQLSDIFEDPAAHYREALDLLDKQKYASASDAFREYLTHNTDKNDEWVVASHYYIGLCSMELFNDDADELMKYFVRTYPESPRVNHAYFLLGQYYYRNRDFDEAITWYSQVETRHIEPDLLPEYNFKFGYAHLQEDDPDMALEYFAAAMDTESEYAAPSAYYYAHINYEKKNYQVALERFYTIQDDPRFGSIVPYYITQILFIQKKYQEVTEYAPAILDTSKVQKRGETARMAGESFFRLKDYENAVVYLEMYEQNATPQRYDKYLLGYSYYQGGDYDKAIKNFTRVTYMNDSLAQVTYYHLADCYLKQGEKNYARTSFKKVYELGHDEVLTEDGHFKYAQLAYELSYNPYDEAIRAFEEYINTYPNSPRKDEAYQYLLSVYMTTKNYQAALESLEKVPHEDLQIKRAYQMIAYNLGVELYHNNKLNNAIGMFRKAGKYPMDVEINALRQYWIAECYYKQKDFKTAIKAYQDFVGLPGAFNTKYFQLAEYNEGYCWFQLREYEKAAGAFRKFTDNYRDNQELETYYQDALIRTGDVYYMLRENEKAIRYYAKAADNRMAGSDYAMFQKAKTYGFDQAFDDKIQELTKLINIYTESRYLAAARYEIAEAYRIQDERTRALNFYGEVVRFHPDNVLVKPSKLAMALIHFKNKEYDKSETLYLDVLSSAPNPEDCREAVDGLRDVYTAVDRIEDWEDIISQSGCTGYDEGDLDTTFFTSARNLFFENQFDKAAESFGKYLSRFPNGIFRTDAHYYRGESYAKLDHLDEAAAAYEKVIDRPVGKFTESALSRLGAIYLFQEEYSDALRVYERLEGLAMYDANILDARSGVMRAAYETLDHEKALRYAQLVLKEEKLDETIEVQAHYIFAFSKYKLGELDIALTEFRKTNNMTKSIWGAKAKYYAAEVLYKQGKYKASEDEIYEMIQQKPGYDYWLAKGYILLADNYMGMGPEMYDQAEATLNSVLQHYPNDDDNIKNEAQQRLTTLQDLRSKGANEPLGGTKNMIIDMGDGEQSEEIYNNLAPREEPDSTMRRRR